MEDLIGGIFSFAVIIFGIWHDSKIYRYDEERLWEEYNNDQLYNVRSYRSYKFQMKFGFYFFILLFILCTLYWMSKVIY